jgi:hypothetical protein
MKGEVCLSGSSRVGRRVSEDLDRGSHTELSLSPLRNVRHDVGFAGLGYRTWLLELSLCVSISCLASTRARYARVIWLRAA